MKEISRIKVEVERGKSSSCCWSDVQCVQRTLRQSDEGRTSGSNRSTLWHICILFCLPNIRRSGAVVYLSIFLQLLLLPLRVLMLRPSRFIKLKTANFVAKVIHQKANRLRKGMGMWTVDCGMWNEMSSADADPFKWEQGRCKVSWICRGSCLTFAALSLSLSSSIAACGEFESCCAPSSLSFYWKGERGLFFRLPVFSVPPAVVGSVCSTVSIGLRTLPFFLLLIFFFLPWKL